MATIKKVILLAFIALVIVGCDKNPKYKITKQYYVVVIDECEYVKYGSAYGFQHKGNCRFCEERRKKELEELLIKLKEK